MKERASDMSRKSLLPSVDGPRVSHARAAEKLDALLAVVPTSSAKQTLPKSAFDALPEHERWQELHARGEARSGTVRSTTLGNRGQTLAVLGYIDPNASTFERLSLAGRMMKESAPRNARAIGLAAALSPLAERATLEALIAAVLSQAFALPAYRSSHGPEHRLQRVAILGGRNLDLGFATAAARGNNLARWLTALPPNMLDAPAYKQTLAALSRRHGLSMRWLDETALRRAGANAFLAVSAGNDAPGAGIAHLRYRPGRRSGGAPQIALVGKGILFDTGGINLKPHRSMLDMHTDMAGSAVALATLIALAELRAPIAVDAWLPITENRIGPHAYRPQDVVRAANGVTIQVIHTDAEGRMVLADTLALAARTQPRLILDFATLTGACVYALTERMSGVFTNQPRLADTLVEAGRASGERVWHFPNDPDYDTDIESKSADVLQCGADGKGDHILATRFLGRFVPERIAWAHVDLSSATRPGGLAHINTDITGFGVRYALELILKQGILDELDASS